MTKDELEQIQNKVEHEGFDYAITYYSDWSEIKDREFKRLRKDFIRARKELSDYLGLEEV